MSKYQYLVTVETTTKEQATQVMAERLSTDEWYGFDYQVEYEEHDTHQSPTNVLGLTG